MDIHRPTTTAEAFLAKFARSWPAEQWQDVTVVVAVSGGADSVSLLRSLVSLAKVGAGRLVAVHVNHALRPTESDLDEQFVSRLCTAVGVACEVVRADPRRLQRSAGKGLEATARLLRYELLRESAGRWGARFVATGHTADDQAETILQRLLRGTSLRGMRGIPRVRALSKEMTLIRPLLEFRREEVLEFLAALGQDFRHDSSNQDRRFTRNRLRHELIPLLMSHYNPHVVDTLLRLGNMAGQIQEILDRRTDELTRTCLRKTHSGTVEIECPALDGTEPLLIREVLLEAWKGQGWPLGDMNWEKWVELANMVQPTAPSPLRKVFPGGVLAERCGAVLRLRSSG